METVTRTVRIKKTDIKRIDEFLRNNPVFDFSSLVRIAIEQFMRNPNLKIKPLNDDQDTGAKDVRPN